MSTDQPPQPPSTGSVHAPSPPPPPPGAGRPVHAAPPAADGRLRGLAPAAVTSWRISAAASWGPPLLVAAVLGATFTDGAAAWGTVLAALVLFAAVVGWLQRARYRRWQWQLTDRAVALSHGVLIHVEEHVPYFRIQQIDVVRGPIDRMLGLATLQVTTASATGSASLPGIDAAEAPGIRVELLARASRAVAEHGGDVQDAV